MISQVTAKACDNKIHMGECNSFVLVKKSTLHVFLLLLKLWSLVSTVSHGAMTGNYSCLVAQFHLKRSISFHLIQVTTLSLSFHPGDNSFFFIWSNWHHIIWFYQSRLPLIPIGCDHLTWYNFQNYLPSILIVAVSWVSFWMDIESVPGRCFSNHLKQTTSKSVFD